MSERVLIQQMDLSCAAFSKASARERSPTKQYLWRHFLLFSRQTFAGARFAERSTDFMSVVMTSFLNGFLNYDVINRLSSPKYNFCDEISEISTIFFHKSQTPQPPIQFW